MLTQATGQVNDHISMGITNLSTFDNDLDDLHRQPSSAPVDISGFIGLTIEGFVFFGNVFPALTVFLLTRRRDRTVTEHFIGALAINDLISVSVPFCVGIPTLLKRRWIGDKLSCKLYQTSVFWCLLNAMLLVTIMSCDRHLALARPIAYKQRVSRRVSLAEWLSLVVGCVTLLISSMPLFGIGGDGINNLDELTHCPSLLIAKPSSQRERVFPVFLITLGYLTLLVVSFCSVASIRLLKRFQSRYHKHSDVGLRKTERQKLEKLPVVVSFTKLVVVLGALFYLTWLPVVVGDLPRAFIQPVCLVVSPKYMLIN